jgi:predicted AlkP superfamily pyrophosphatase or phosphodiesterase
MNYLLHETVAKGVKGKGLIPPFPAQSFPAQYSMITGWYPSEHGIVGDYFHDFGVNAHLINSFGRNDTSTVANNAFWDGDPVSPQLQHCVQF